MIKKKNHALAWFFMGGGELSDVKQEVHHVAVFDDVLFTF